VLQEPMAAVLPVGTPMVLVFLVIAVPVVAASVIGLSAAYPRVVVAPDGVLGVRGRSVSPTGIVRARLSGTRGEGRAYLVLTLGTRDGRSIRILVAGPPVRGLDDGQLRLLRDTVATSAIPTHGEPTEASAFFGGNLSAARRRMDADRDLVLRELDELRAAL